jgi:hypothetical protein
MHSSWPEARGSDLKICARSPKKASLSTKKSTPRKEAGLSDLKAHTRVIMQTLEFATRSHALDPLPAYLAEGTFAAQHLLRERDLSGLRKARKLIDGTI